jgi:hypothetical protein
MLTVFICFWFGALLAGLDSLILAAFAQMKLSDRVWTWVSRNRNESPTWISREEWSARYNKSGCAATPALQLWAVGLPTAIRASFGLNGTSLWNHETSWNKIAHAWPHPSKDASARARRQATGRIEPREKRQNISIKGQS